jgi:hypothetical protein
MTIVDVSTNDLSTLTTATIHRLATDKCLARLNFSHNPFDCDCHLHALHALIQKDERTQDDLIADLMDERFKSGVDFLEYLFRQFYENKIKTLHSTIPVLLLLFGRE